MSWWSLHFNRPTKDPILLSYTVEELAYEYFNTIERKKAEEERVQAESDKIEEAKRLEAEKWADEAEAEDAEDVKKAKDISSPASDPDNIEWMNKVLEESKQEHGETFGEDLSLDFGNK